MTGPEDGPTREELLDATPEGLAMRRTREARAEAAARAARGLAGPPRRTSRRRAVVGGALLLLGALRVVERSVRGGRN